MPFSDSSDYPSTSPFQSSIELKGSILGSYSTFNRSLGSGFMEGHYRLSRSSDIERSTDFSNMSRSSMSEFRSQSVDINGIFSAAQVSWLRKECFYIYTARLFNNSILSIIALNTILLALQTTTYLNANYGWYFALVDQAFLGIYVMETFVKIYVLRLHYFKSGWNNFDFIIVLTSIIVFLLPIFISSNSFNPRVIRVFRAFRAIRAIRSLRALRAISFLRSLQVIVQTLLRSIPAMSSILTLAGLILYIFAVVGRSLFSSTKPDFFGTLGITIFRLYAFITLDNWSDAFRTDSSLIFGQIFAFQLFYIILESFVLLNLFIAVIVSNLSEVQKRSSKQQKREYMDDIAAQEEEAREDALEELNLRKEKEHMLEIVKVLRSEAGLENFYASSLNARVKSLISLYFMEVACLENNRRVYQAHQQSLEDLVDLFKYIRNKG